MFLICHTPQKKFHFLLDYYKEISTFASLNSFPEELFFQTKLPRRGNRKTKRVGKVKNLCFMIKNLFLLILAIAVSLNFSSCSNNDNDDFNEVTIEITPIGEMLSAIVENTEFGKEVIFLTCNTDGSYFVSFTSMESEKESSAMTRATNDDWHFAGTVKGKLSALRLASDLSSKLSSDRVVLLKIVPTGNEGEWNVYWKYDD